MPQIGFLVSLTKLLGKQQASHSPRSPERCRGWVALESLSKPAVKTRILNLFSRPTLGNIGHQWKTLSFRLFKNILPSCRLSFWVFIVRRKGSPWTFRETGRPFLTGKGESISSLSPDSYHIRSSAQKLGLTYCCRPGLGPLAQSVGLEAEIEAPVSGSLFSLHGWLVVRHQRASRGLPRMVWTCHCVVFHCTVLGPNSRAPPES